MRNIKYITISEYVDVDTAEVLDKRTVEKEYSIIKKHKHSKIQEHDNIKRITITITNDCRRKSLGASYAPRY